MTIRNHGGWDNWSIIEVEKYPCNDSNEARARERYWFENLSASLNTFNPLRTKEDDILLKKLYREANKEALELYHKMYREEHWKKNC